MAGAGAAVDHEQERLGGAGVAGRGLDREHVGVERGAEVPAHRDRTGNVVRDRLLGARSVDGIDVGQGRAGPAGVVRGEARDGVAVAGDRVQMEATEGGTGRERVGHGGPADRGNEHAYPDHTGRREGEAQPLRERRLHEGIRIPF
ncbi:hypothetical protein GCM10020218_009080 [Dactylosporangium vinaceum]